MALDHLKAGMKQYVGNLEQTRDLCDLINNFSLSMFNNRTNLDYPVLKQEGI